MITDSSSSPRDIAALIVGKAKGEPVSPTEEVTDSENGVVEEAAGEVMEAMQSGDKAAFAEALKSFISICLP